MFYKPKHHKSKYNLSFDNFHAVMNFVIEETIWYFLWWVELTIKFFQKLYQFGEWILASGVKLIDKLDKFLEEWDNGSPSDC